MRSGATYSPDQFASLFAVEDRHFWFQSRNRCIAAALRSLPDFQAIRRVLEVGCGTGVVLAELQRQFPNSEVVGMDLFDEGLAFARQRFRGTLIQGDVFTSTFDSPFDVLGAFDVIEHLDDDCAALSRFREQLRDGGHLVITVPAHQALWSYFDEAALHRRRYDVPGLRRKLESAGFCDIYVTPFMAALFPMMWLKRRLLGGHLGRQRGDDRQRERAVASDLQIGAVSNWLLRTALRPDAWLVARGLRVPIGTSLLAVARRPLASVDHA